MPPVSEREAKKIVVQLVLSVVTTVHVDLQTNKPKGFR